MNLKSESLPFRLSFEFGEFSHNAFGISIHLPASLGSLFPAFVGQHMGFGKPESHLKFMEGIKNVKDDNLLFQILCYITVLEHELRHYHDFLSTRMGNEIMYCDMMIASYSNAISNDLKDERSIVVPIDSWVGMNDTIFKSLRTDEASASLRRTPPEVTTMIAKAVRRALERKKETLGSDSERSEDLRFSTEQLLESTALSTQFAHLWKISSENPELKDWYTSEIRKRDTQEKYSKIWNYWETLEQKLGLEFPVYAAIRNTIEYFCLNAIDRADNIRHHPTAVFYNMWNDMLEERSVPDSNNLLKWLDVQADKFGLLSLSESLKASVILARNRAAELRSACENTEAINSLPDEVLTAYDHWVDAHEYMCEKIIEDPMAYCDPQSYIKNFDLWVSAQKILTSNTTIFNDKETAMSLERYLEKGFGEFNPVENGFSLCFGYKTRGVEIITQTDASLLSYNVRVSDAFWAKDNTDPAWADYVASFLKEHCTCPDWNVIML